MEPKLIKMPSIPQFRNVITDVGHVARFRGLDEAGDPIYATDAKLPTIKFVGSVKLHGTNASVCYNGYNLWAQSKGNVITVDKDNAGFAFFTETKRDYLTDKLSEIKAELQADEVCVYGEWAGKGIQKGVAISEVEKKFYPFGIKYKLMDEEDYRWVQIPYEMLSNLANEEDIRNIFEFNTYTIEIDFKEPKMSQNKMIEITEAVEAMCPVGKAHGVEGIGEGVVWVGWYKNQKFEFKVKGDKHANSKVKTLAPVDEAKEQLKNDFVNNHACKGWRLEQMYAETFDTLNGGKGDIKKTGDFLRAVIGDVMKEELDILVQMGLEPKEVNAKISKVAREWFMEQLDKEAGVV